MVIEVSAADKEGFYNVNERFRRSVNTTIISGVAETGSFQPEAIEETARVVKELMGLIKQQDVKEEDIYIAGSSALMKANNRDALSGKVKEMTGKDMVFIDKDREVFYGIVGSIPQKYRNNALLIDIGSGNTKLGYLDAERTVSVDMPYGTVSLTEAVKKKNPSEKAYTTSALNITAQEMKPKLRQAAARRPSLVNRKPVFMVGGIVWAMSTILYPEREDSFVKLTMDDINRFYELVAKKKGAAFEQNLTKIKNMDTRKKAEKQLQSVKDVFTVENLIAGAAILKAMGDELKLKGKDLYFSRNGSWLWGYIAYEGTEKFEKK